MDSDASSPVSGTSSATETSQATSSTPSGAAGEFNASTPISNMEDLREKAPTVYNAMMQGIATTIINQMKDHQDKLKEMMREATRNAQGG